jgi:magnesium chelatase family protein
LEQKLREGLLSARGLQKVKRVARTVADLSGEAVVSHAHVAEAISLRAGRNAIVA